MTTTTTTLAPPPLDPSRLVYQCDSCESTPLRLKRYRCQQCEDYDLCFNCFASDAHTPGHSFLETQIPPSSSEVPPEAPSEVPLALQTSRPSRRSNRFGADSSIERMDDVLARNQVGPVVATYSSSSLALQFLEVFDLGARASERKKKSKALEQLCARMGIALVGVPKRIRRGTSFVAKQMPVEQEFVGGAMAGLVAEMMGLEDQKAFPGGGLGKIQKNVDRGSYFRKFESPEKALMVFQKHLAGVYAQTKHEANCKQAIEEMRDAFSLPQEDFGADDGLNVVVELEEAAPAAPAQIGASYMKKARRSDPLAASVISATTSLTESASRVHHSSSSSRKRSRHTVDEDFDSNLNGESTKRILKKMREELDDAHARIDVLVHLLREKVAVPLMRGISRADR